jgi:hypothetical protein
MNTSLPIIVVQEIKDYTLCAVASYCDKNASFRKRFLENNQVGELIHCEFETNVSKDWWNIDSWMFNSSPKIIESVFQYINNLTSQNLTVKDFKNPIVFMEYVARIWAIDNQKWIRQMVCAYICENPIIEEEEDEKVEYVITSDEEEDDNEVLENDLENVAENEIEIYRIVPDEDDTDEVINDLENVAENDKEIYRIVPDEDDTDEVINDLENVAENDKEIYRIVPDTEEEEENDVEIYRNSQNYTDDDFTQLWNVIKQHILNAHKRDSL